MIEPFQPITREDAAGILHISLTTLDAMIAKAVLPAPRQLGACRKLYWHPDTFYGVLHRLLWVDPASIALASPEPLEAARESRPRKDEAHAEAATTSSDSAKAAPSSPPRRLRDPLARQAERLQALNR